jgi:hypothetical protein
VNSSVKELNLKRPVFDLPFLTDELIEAREPDLAAAAGRTIDTASVSRLGAVELDAEPNAPAVRRRSQHHVQIAAVKPKDDTR